MNKKLIIAVCLHFLFIQVIWSQENKSEQMTTSVTKVTIIEPGIGHEFPIGKKSTLFLRSGLTASLATDYFDEITGVLFRLFGSASGRIYYNFEKRNLMEKNTGRNSANYFALLFLAAASPLNKGIDYDQELNNTLINTGLVWGMQRNYNSRVSLDLNIGIGYVSVGNIGGFSPVGEFNIGIWLGSKKQ